MKVELMVSLRADCSAGPKDPSWVDSLVAQWVAMTVAHWAVLKELMWAGEWASS